MYMKLALARPPRWVGGVVLCEIAAEGEDQGGRGGEGSAAQRFAGNEFEGEVVNAN